LFAAAIAAISRALPTTNCKNPNKIVPRTQSSGYEIIVKENVKLRG
jgi:hypothetical protein